MERFDLQWRHIRKARSAIALVLVCLLTSSCYLPVRFDSEIELSREGYYKFIFDGYLVQVPFYDKLHKGEIGPTEERKDVAQYEQDLKNDPAMKEVSYVRQGIFKVHWERDGDITRDKYVTFFRRNENILSLRFVKTDYTIRLAGKGLPKNQKQQLVDIGLNSVGEIRIITNAKVIADNATVKQDWPDKGPGYKMYRWPIANIFAASPQFVVSLR